MTYHFKTSIVDKGVKRCYLCGSTHSLEVHHIFGGANRKKSTDYGLVVYLCKECHTGSNGVHNNADKMKELRKKGQEAFENEYPQLDFVKIFHRNYK